MIPAHLARIVTEFRETADKVPRDFNQKWVGIIIHHTGIDKEPADAAGWVGLFKSITGWLTAKDSAYLSAHFHIGREGECAMLADPDKFTTYHAGESSFFHPLLRRVVPGWNAYAIGIELLGDGNRLAYTDKQYDKLASLCAALMLRFPTIDPRCITGHENVSPGRKADPGRNFDWMRFNRLLFKRYASVVS